MTNHQLQLIHLAKRELRLDDEQYRAILDGIGHVVSSKFLSQRGFENVMAFFEGHGWQQQGQPADYWRNRVEMREKYANPREVFLMRKLHRQCVAADLKPSTLEGFAMRMSNGRTQEPSKLRRTEARDVIEGLKMILQRNGIEPDICSPGAPGPSPAVPAPAPTPSQNRDREGATILLPPT